MRGGNGRKHILLVDDDRPENKMLTMLLETRGYHVTSAYSGKEAIKDISPDIDIVLLDLILPDEDGFDVCNKLKKSKKSSQIPIIILSAKMLCEDIVEGLYMGADDYLTKPFNYEELVARIEAVVRRGAIFQDEEVPQHGYDSIISELRKIIDKELVEPFYQPIFQLKPFKVIGLEVLTRPKTKGYLSDPCLLFKTAIHFGFYHDLELTCWRKALKKASPHIKKEKLFLNCNPYLIEGAKVARVERLFKDAKIEAENAVLEITERSAISEYKIFYRRLKEYRKCGFKFAVDDVGGGYASLESIIETKPEVVKIDRHIIAGVESDPYKKSIVKFIVSFCQENNIFSVAEGVETKEQFEAVKKLGVTAVQGYYLYRPTPKINIDRMNKCLSSH